jgi:hypothetical protein
MRLGTYVALAILVLNIALTVAVTGIAFSKPIGQDPPTFLTATIFHGSCMKSK